MITIITPSYNRAYIIRKAYESLLAQTSKDFEWLIIDDGSKDNTKKVVEEFINENKIKIRYYYKENGGKHTALNLGIKKAKGDYILILDSDDRLTPNAVSRVLEVWKKYKSENEIACLSFSKVYKNNKKIGKEYIGTEIRSNHIDFRCNQELTGDMCEIYRTKVLRKHPFPVFNNEKFLSEAIVWNKIGSNYDTIYMNEGIYIAEYLNDGLSKNWFKLVVNSPLGARANNLLFLSKKFKFKITLKNPIMYTAFSFIAKKPIFKETNMKITSLIFYIPSFFVAKFLEFKYKTNG